MWLLRWEYSRERPRADYAYPLAHIHAARVPLELVLWHLIAEWGVTPKTDGWYDVLGESLAGFEQRRTAP